MTNETEQVRGIPMTNRLWDSLADRAKRNGRATCREAAAIIKEALEKGGKE